MSPIAVFFRTLMKTSAIFIGTTLVFLHPPLDWTNGRAVTAGQSGTEAVIDALTGALKDPDAGVRREAAAALGNRSSRRAVPALLAALKDTDVQVRVRVISALGEIGDPAAVEALIGILHDANVDVRRRAVRALGEIGDARAVPALTGAMKDEDAMVRRYAVRAIAEIDGDDAGPRRSLGGGGPRPVRIRSRVLCSAADMAATLVLMLPLLIACGDAAAQTRQDARQLVAQLSAADPQVRAKAACGLRELGDDAAIAVDALVALLPDGAPIPMTVCERNWGRWGHEPTTTPGEQAASALVSIGSRTLKPLLAAVSHSSWIARRNAAWALGALDDAAASPALMKALNDSESPVRQQSAWALGAIDEPSAVDALIRALKDPDQGVRQQAAWALGAIDDPRAVNPLMQSLKDSEPKVREQAAWALGAIGDHRAVDALLPALKDAEARVRRQAAWAIGVLSR